MVFAYTTLIVIFPEYVVFNSLYLEFLNLLIEDTVTIEDQFIKHYSFIIINPSSVTNRLAMDWPAMKRPIPKSYFLYTPQ